MSPEPHGHILRHQAYLCADHFETGMHLTTNKMHLTTNKTKREGLMNQTSFIDDAWLLLLFPPTIPFCTSFSFFVLFFIFIFYPSYFIHMRLFTVEPWSSDHLRVIDVVLPFLHRFIQLRLQARIQDRRVIRETPPQRLLLLRLLLLLYLL